MNERELRNLVIGTALIVVFFAAFSWMMSSPQAQDPTNWVYHADFYRDHHHPCQTGDQLQLLANDGREFDGFGYSIDMHGNKALVGANQDGSGSGVAYIFDRNHGGAEQWGEVKKLTASEHDSGSTGNPISVSISGDTVVIGSALHNDSHGAAYIFDRDEGGSNNWGKVIELLPDDSEEGDYFGWVALEQDTLVVGASGDNNDKGSAYIFERDHNGRNNWGQIAELTASDGVSDDRFGLAVAISRNIVIIGSRGAVYIFERNQDGLNNWGQVTKLTANVGTSAFGSAVAINQTTIIVGDHDAREVYIFEQNQGGTNNWGLVKKISGNDDTPNNSFGRSVDIKGNQAVVADNSIYAGHVYQRHKGGINNWGEMRKLKLCDGGNFFSTIAQSNNTILIGSPTYKTYQGAAYLFPDFKIYLPVLVK